MTLDNFIDSKPVQAILEKRGYIIKKTHKVKEIIDIYDHISVIELREAYDKAVPKLFN